MSALRRIARHGRGFGAAVGAVVVIGAPCAVAAPSARPLPSWGVDGGVEALLRVRDRLYIGGQFDYVGPNTGSAVPLDRGTGKRRRRFPPVDGEVDAIIPDRAGGYFMGGDFARVGGVVRRYLAHVKPDGRLDRAWNPRPDAPVLALAQGGSRVFVGGLFKHMGGSPRSALAAVDGRTGAVAAWNPGASSAGGELNVFALAAAGSRVYVGGQFGAIAGQPRHSIAAVDARTGAVLGWNPDAGDTTSPVVSRVSALVASGGTVYAGGDFNMIGGRRRWGIAALSGRTGAATAWNPKAVDIDESGIVTALAVSGRRVYAGGDFTRIGGRDRIDLAALDARSGGATSFRPDPDSSVFALAVSRGSVYVGGDFEAIGGRRRRGLAAVDARSGAATRWDPNPDPSGSPNALAVSGSTVYAAGDFTSLNGRARHNIAALDARTGALTAWNPGADDAVEALAASGWPGQVFAGGSFTRIGGQERAHIAALSARSGAATGWNPDASDNVYVLRVAGSRVYAGGAFARIGGRARRHVSALGLRSGRATAWNPRANGSAVRALLVSGARVYVGGDFTRIGGRARRRVAAIGLRSGRATAWNPSADADVDALAVSRRHVYAGGDFTRIGGRPRGYLAVLDTRSGAASAWDARLSYVPCPVPDPNNAQCSDPAGVDALDLVGSRLYVGGRFTTIGGRARHDLAALSTRTAAALSWDPRPDAEVASVTATRSSIAVAGIFSSLGRDLRSGVALLGSHKAN